MATNIQQERYLYNTVQQASPAQLLIMLYDGCIRFCKLAIFELEKKNIEAANVNLLKAQGIIQELMVTLDMKYPVSDGLYKLYDYIYYLLIQANLNKNGEPVHEVLSYLTELRQTWFEVSKKLQENIG